MGSQDNVTRRDPSRFHLEHVTGYQSQENSRKGIEKEDAFPEGRGAAPEQRQKDQKERQDGDMRDVVFEPDEKRRGRQQKAPGDKSDGRLGFRVKPLHKLSTFP